MLLGLVVVGALGCKVTASDVDYWKGTRKGPGKIVAVMQSDNYPIELRTTAALALVQMERNDVKGVAELQRALQGIDEQTRAAIVSGITPGLEEILRGADTPPESGTPPPNVQVRAKDAAYLLIAQAQGDTRERLIHAVIAWYVVDFNGRSLSGDYSAEQIIRSLGGTAANLLVDALNAEMPQQALVKLAELIGQLGDGDTKARAGARLVEIEQRMESDAFLDWLKNRIRNQARTQNPGQDIDEARVNALALLNRESFITDGALPAMKHLADQAGVSERLLAIASVPRTEQNIVDRRKKALQALEGNATQAHLQRLLSLALSNDSPVAVRDYAFDRVGDIRSPEAIPPMWPLVSGSGSTDAQRLRWRAGEMVLAIGGPHVVAEFLSKLPREGELKYEPEELEGYATRLSQMTPPPTEVVRGQLRSPDWWDRVIALRYFERRGTEADIPQMQQLAHDDARVQGEHWERMHIDTVGKVAESAVAGLRERLAGAADRPEGPQQPPSEGGSD